MIVFLISRFWVERKILIIHFFSFVLGRREIFFCEMEEFYFNFTLFYIPFNLNFYFTLHTLLPFNYHFTSILLYFTNHFTFYIPFYFNFTHVTYHFTIYLTFYLNFFLVANNILVLFWLISITIVPQFWLIQW